MWVVNKRLNTQYSGLVLRKPVNLTMPPSLSAPEPPFVTMRRSASRCHSGWVFDQSRIVSRTVFGGSADFFTVPLGTFRQEMSLGVFSSSANPPFRTPRRSAAPNRLPSAPPHSFYHAPGCAPVSAPNNRHSTLERARTCSHVRARSTHARISPSGAKRTPSLAFPVSLFCAAGNGSRACERGFVLRAPASYLYCGSPAYSRYGPSAPLQ